MSSHATTILPARTALERAAFAADVRDGLGTPGQKEIPSRYLYDAVGSALFETITHLPEYGLARADQRLLRRHAGRIAGFSDLPVIVAELGSGSGRKTRWVLRELSRRHQAVTYHPIDVSALSLERCRVEMSEIPGVRIAPLRMPYLEGLRRVARRRPSGRALLVLFLGSTIGNFQREEAAGFLMEVRSHLLGRDALLLGTDLQSDPSRLGPAYDDPAGVTAAFNRNVLARINRELKGAFDPRAFDHEARWNAAERRVEMHLVSRHPHTVDIPGARLSARFARGESIWTESSCKFDVAEVDRLASTAGFVREEQWIDGRWPFAESLLRAADAP
ncbi:MAG: L-histidine N(alpha)-methyltransferase [Candidatus Polarisedimenticolia bacterium]